MPGLCRTVCGRICSMLFIWRAKPAGKISLVYAVNEGLLDQQRHSRRRRMLRRRAGRPLGCGRQAISLLCGQPGVSVGRGGPLRRRRQSFVRRGSAAAAEAARCGFPRFRFPRAAAEGGTIRFRTEEFGRTHMIVRPAFMLYSGQTAKSAAFVSKFVGKACYPKERGRSRSPAERWRKSGQVGLYSGKCRCSSRRGTVRYVNPSSLSAAQTRSRFSPMRSVSCASEAKDTSLPPSS